MAIFVHLTGPGKEAIDACRSVLDLYTDTYRQICNQTSELSSSSVASKNQCVQLQCLLLEGIVIIHQVCVAV